MKVLVFAEQRAGKLKPATLEALTLAATFAPANQVACVLIGDGVASLAGQLQGYGADKVLLAEGDHLRNYNVLHYTDAVHEACKRFSPRIILGAASPMGRDLFPRLAARLNAGILTDLTECKLEGENLVGVKPMYAGKCLAEVALVNSSVQLATVRPNVFAAKKAGSGSAAVEKLTVSPQSSPKLEIKEIRKGRSEKPDLTEASIIISGGRALGSADNFKILHECGEVLDATVGASRAAVDSGYAPHDMQVGQTGKTVNPNLYIACGISGSIQHMAGMRTSKVIVAINTDKEAPIFSIANYGIIADLFQVVPVLTKKFRDFVS